MEQQDLFNDQEDKSLLSAFAWWEKRRLFYNLAVGITGLMCLLLNPFLFTYPLGILIYGILANLCYSLGFFIELVTKYYFKSKMDFTEKRKMLFILGVISSILLTIGIAYISLTIFALNFD